MRERKIVKMKLVVDEVYGSIQDCAERNNLDPSTISNRIKNRVIAADSLFMHYEPELVDEEWKVHPSLGFEVSKEGRIRYFDGKIANVSGTRYMKIGFKNKYYNIHRLVAETFLHNPESKPIVHHKDHNKQNNCVTNLQWVTQKENMQYYFEYKNKK